MPEIEMYKDINKDKSYTDGNTVVVLKLHRAESPVSFLRTSNVVGYQRVHHRAENCEARFITSLLQMIWLALGTLRGHLANPLKHAALWDVLHHLDRLVAGGESFSPRNLSNISSTSSERVDSLEDTLTELFMQLSPGDLALWDRRISAADAEDHPASVDKSTEHATMYLLSTFLRPIASSSPASSCSSSANPSELGDSARLEDDASIDVDEAANPQQASTRMETRPEVVAREGVEESEERAAARRKYCRRVQGWLNGAPVTFLDDMESTEEEALRAYVRKVFRTASASNASASDHDAWTSTPVPTEIADAEDRHPALAPESAAQVADASAHVEDPAPSIDKQDTSNHIHSPTLRHASPSPTSAGVAAPARKSGPATVSAIDDARNADPSERAININLALPTTLSLLADVALSSSPDIIC